MTLDASEAVIKKWPQYFGRYNPTGKIYHRAPVYINKQGLFLFVNQMGAWSANAKVNELGLLRGTDTGKDGNCVASVTDWEVWDNHDWRSANITVSCIKGSQRYDRHVLNTHHLSNQHLTIPDEGHPPGPRHPLAHEGEAVSLLPMQGYLHQVRAVRAKCYFVFYPLVNLN